MDHAVIADTLKTLLTHLQLPFDDVSVNEDSEAGFIRIDIVSTRPSQIIGWHGETLNSLQHLLKSLIRSLEKLEKSPFLVVDTDGYRRMQEDKVRKVVEQKADFVRRTGSRIALQPMSPYFRRVAHVFIAASPQYADLTTESIGEGDYRQVVLKQKSDKQSRIAEGEELSPVIEEEAGFENLDV